MAMTRRSLLNGMAKLGGAGAVYETLSIWEFLKPVPAVAASLTIPADAGKGKTVSVLADPSPPARIALPEQLVLGKERYGR